MHNLGIVMIAIGAFSFVMFSVIVLAVGTGMIAEDKNKPWKDRLCWRRVVIGETVCIALIGIGVMMVLN